MFQKQKLGNAVVKNRKARRRENFLCENNIWPVIGAQQIWLMKLIKVKITRILLSPLQLIFMLSNQILANFNFIESTTNTLIIGMTFFSLVVRKSKQYNATTNKCLHNRHHECKRKPRACHCTELKYVEGEPIFSQFPQKLPFELKYNLTDPPTSEKNSGAWNNLTTWRVFWRTSTNS